MPFKQHIHLTTCVMCVNVYRHRMYARAKIKPLQKQRIELLDWIFLLLSSWLFFLKRFNEELVFTLQTRILLSLIFFYNIVYNFVFKMYLICMIHTSFRVQVCWEWDAHGSSVLFELKKKRERHRERMNRER